MTIKVQFSALTERWDQYEHPLRDAFANLGLDVDLRTEFPPDEVDYLIYAPNSSVSDFGPYTKCKAVLNLWAGVDQVVGNPTLDKPLTRMVDYGLSQGMIEWVTGHVLRHHLGMDKYLNGQDGEWRLGAPPMSRDRSVVIFGFGALGQACGEALANLDFKVSGWSNSPKQHDRITTFHGKDGFSEALTLAEIAVLLLPATADTENMFNAAAFAKMPKDSVIINPGRGNLIHDVDLLDSLDAGHLGHATLDVFRVEPLPKDDPFWSHPKVTVTPHIASETRASTAAEVIAENIRRGEADEPFLHLVDMDKGY